MAVSTRQLVTSKIVTRNKLTSNELTSLNIKERALGLAEGLTSTEAPNDMTGWYCQAYKQLGEGKYCAAAGAARSGKQPKRLFGWLLKNEMQHKVTS